MTISVKKFILVGLSISVTNIVLISSSFLLRNQWPVKLYSEGSNENQPIIHKYYNSSSRRNSKHSVTPKKATQKKTTLRHEIKPAVLTPPPTSFEQRKVCNGQCKTNNENSSRSATPILQSFVILNDECETNMCDNCGDQKLASLGKIRKQKSG